MTGKLYLSSIELQSAIPEETKKLIVTRQEPRTIGECELRRNLAPSWFLVRKKEWLKKEGWWNIENFEKIYIPIFKKEMEKMKLEEILEDMKKGQSYAFLAFSRDVNLCHRKILAQWFFDRGVEVFSVNEKK